MYGNSGGEAMDFAIKLSRAYTGRPGIISAVLGFHGHTGFALSAIRSIHTKSFSVHSCQASSKWSTTAWTRSPRWWTTLRPRSSSNLCRASAG